MNTKLFRITDIEKGKYCYMDAHKRKMLTFSIIGLITVFIIFITGIIIYHTNKSIFAVIAAVASLPAAKQLTGYIIVFPFKSGSKDIYDFLCTTKGKYEGCIGCDLAITSDKQACFIQFAYCNNGNLFMYSDYNKIDVSYTEQYTKKLLDENCNYSSVKLFTNKEKYIERIKLINETSNVNNMDERIIHKLLTYSI